ncbi:tripartite tricarboxylate transporter substrate binding protein [Roseicella frigidaeris]|uniref:Tripartite tricarboxylate transporter substrate binding protein n=1 Tax=Roseicella frigidaeris TaxID=2230885 RepID=A0A327MDW9_9PROT|nr:tripartite tricarboxylate transporter substrate binding protein [Roseicella frigidaeris]RAI60867.1 tripartite tricarboxylate transporter substrate binding protein [Roseicella frigidaeris]
MRRRHALALLLLPGLAAAQATDPPRRGNGPIRLIVPFAPGGGVDTAARILAPPLADALGRAILIENRPGGRGIPGAEALMHAAPDGRTLGLTNTAPLGMAPLVDRPPYDSDRDFTHVALIAETPSVLLVPAGSRFAGFEPWLRAAQSWRRGLTYGSPALGSLQHLQGEMLAKATGAQLTHIAYRGTAAAMQDLVNDQVDSLIAPLASAMPALQAGRVRALAVSGPVPGRLADVPSFAALGLPQLTATAWTGLSGPRDLPPDLVVQLNRAVNRVVALPQVAEALRAAGLTPPPQPLDAEDYRRLVADFQRAWRPVVEAAGMAAR